MDDEPGEKFLGIQSFPKVPEFEPDVAKKQTQWVRYGNGIRNVATREGWQFSKSDQQSSTDLSAQRGVTQPLGPGLTRTLSPMARARAPERVTVRVSQAPGVFSLPLKVKKTIRPNFKVKVSVSYRSGSGVSFVCTVRAFVLTETDRSDLPAWRESVEDAKSWLSGTTSISHVFDDTVKQADAQNRDPEVMRQESLHKQGSMGGYVPEGMAPDSLLNASPFGSMEMGCGAELLETGHGNMVGGGGPDYTAARQMRRQASGAGQSNGELKYMTHEFEFCDLKITKPSRMKKVYMLFAVSVLDRDQLFAVYHVPTIVIAHITNQGERALESLQGHVEKAPSSGVLEDDADPGHDAQGPAPPAPSMPMPPALGPLGVNPGEFDDNYSPTMAGGSIQPASPAISNSNPSMGQTPTMMPQSTRWMQPGSMPPADRSEGYDGGGGGNWGVGHQSDAFNMGNMLNAAVGMDRQGSYASGGNGFGMMPAKQEDPVFYSVEVIREYVITKYEAAGLTRPLTEMDIRILELQAGFPDSHEARRLGMQISYEQWKTFQEWYGEIIDLLMKIRTTWNQSDPTAVAGLEVGRTTACRALQRQTPGTFMIRLSLSQPGSVVLSIKSPELEESDGAGVVHALLQKDDLHGRRICTWIRDFPYAKMLLDIYTGNVVSKKDVCMPDYVRLASVDANCDRTRFGILDNQ